MKFLPDSVREVRRTQIVLLTCSAIMLSAHLWVAALTHSTPRYVSAAIWLLPCIVNGWSLWRHRDL